MLLKARGCRLHRLHQTYLRLSCKLNCKFSTSSCLLKKIQVSELDLSLFPPHKIRNFGIIAHIDHGKSTLADRLLEVTGAIEALPTNKQVLDSLPVERERGITVKAQTASIVHQHEGQDYLLNFIDTPGHVDFTYEVSRSMSACQGVLLLVDASQGIQAQTVANYYLAVEHDLPIIPVLNKIDLKTARVDSVLEEMKTVFGVEPNEVIHISAKLGMNINEVLNAIVTRLPCPVPNDAKGFSRSNPLKMLLFDSVYEHHRGVTAYVTVLDGILKIGDVFSSHYIKNRPKHLKQSYTVHEVGVLRPHREQTSVLYPGQVGYLVSGMRNTSDAQIGDTLFHEGKEVEALPGFTKAKPVVYAGVFPTDAKDYDKLSAGINKLTLHDRSLSVEKTEAPILGRGFRVGFLGLLHMEIFQQRLEQEYDSQIVIASPNVVFKALLKPSKKLGTKEVSEIFITRPSQYPDPVHVKEFLQPFVIATIIAPLDYNYDILKLCADRNGTLLNNTFISNSQCMVVTKMPSSDILMDNFFDTLKRITSGYASFDYEEAPYEQADVKKVDFLINGTQIPEISKVCTVDKVDAISRDTCSQLKQLLPSEVCQLSIQAVIDKKVICKVTKPPFKINVIAKCSGGDYMRKVKLLKRHAERLKKLRQLGYHSVPRDVFINLAKMKK